MPLSPAPAVVRSAPKEKGKAIRPPWSKVRFFVASAPQNDGGVGARRMAAWFLWLWIPAFAPMQGSSSGITVLKGALGATEAAHQASF